SRPARLRGGAKVRSTFVHAPRAEPEALAAVNRRLAEPDCMTLLATANSEVTPGAEARLVNAPTVPASANTILVSASHRPAAINERPLSVPSALQQRYSMSSGNVRSSCAPAQFLTAHQPRLAGRNIRWLLALAATCRSMNCFCARRGWSQAPKRERTYQRW